MSDFDLQGLAQVYASIEIPAHKRIINDGINEIVSTRREIAAAKAEIERLRERVGGLEVGLLKFCGEAEFKESVCGTMGHFQSAYDYAQNLRTQAEAADKGRR